MAICLTPTDPLPRAVYVLNGFEPSKHKNVSVFYIFHRCWNGADNAILPHGIHRDQRKSQKWPYTCLLSFRAYSHFVRTHFSLPRVSVKKLQRLTLNLVDAFTMRLTWSDLLLGALCVKAYNIYFLSWNCFLSRRFHQKFFEWRWPCYAALRFKRVWSW